jgi:hypothetical protein
MQKTFRIRKRNDPAHFRFDTTEKRIERAAESPKTLFKAVEFFRINGTDATPPNGLQDVKAGRAYVSLMNMRGPLQTASKTITKAARP